MGRSSGVEPKKLRGSDPGDASSALWEQLEQPFGDFY